jgi:UDP:flavonoid glycosyltransferase YjiC (YdhE family)
VEQVREGVETVLKDPKFKAGALEMQEEARRYDPIELIVEEIKAMAVGKHSDGTDLRTPSWTNIISDD